MDSKEHEPEEPINLAKGHQRLLDTSVKLHMIADTPRPVQMRDIWLHLIESLTGSSHRANIHAIIANQVC